MSARKPKKDKLRHKTGETMSFRERMQTANPKAELDVLIELQKRHLLDDMMPLGTTIIFYEDGCLIRTKENVTRKMLQTAVGFTVPDFPFLWHKIPVYLDGPVHKRRGVLKRDWKINNLLDASSFKTLRFDYKPPLSKLRLTEIVNTIQMRLSMAMRHDTELEAHL